MAETEFLLNDWLTKSKIIGLVLGPLFFILVLTFVKPGTLSEHSIIVLALGAWVITWWVTEAMPIPVSALLPMVAPPIATVVGVIAPNENVAAGVVVGFATVQETPLAVTQENVETVPATVQDSALPLASTPRG